MYVLYSEYYLQPFPYVSPTQHDQLRGNICICTYFAMPCHNLILLKSALGNGHLESYQTMHACMHRDHRDHHKHVRMLMCNGRILSFPSYLISVSILSNHGAHLTSLLIYGCGLVSSSRTFWYVSLHSDVIDDIT